MPTFDLEDMQGRLFACIPCGPKNFAEARRPAVQPDAVVPWHEAYAIVAALATRVNLVINELILRSANSIASTHAGIRIELTEHQHNDETLGRQVRGKSSEAIPRVYQELAVSRLRDRFGAKFSACQKSGKLASFKSRRKCELV